MAASGLENNFKWQFTSFFIQNDLGKNPRLNIHDWLSSVSGWHVMAKNRYFLFVLKFIILKLLLWGGIHE